MKLKPTIISKPIEIKQFKEGLCIKELKEILNHLPDDTEIVIEEDEYGADPVQSIEICLVSATNDDEDEHQFDNSTKKVLVLKYTY